LSTKVFDQVAAPEEKHGCLPSSTVLLVVEDLTSGFNTISRFNDASVRRVCDATSRSNSS